VLSVLGASGAGQGFLAFGFEVQTSCGFACEHLLATSDWALALFVPHEHPRFWNVKCGCSCSFRSPMYALHVLNHSRLRANDLSTVWLVALKCLLALLVGSLVDAVVLFR
jgi:hypothetical protein